jgi:hypothetical protein
MKRWMGCLVLFLAAVSVSPAAPPRKKTPAKRPVPVVARLVRLGAREHEAKPPIAITLVPGPVAGMGRQRARVWVRPLVDAERLEVKVVTQAGLEIVSGRREWRSAARKDGAQSEEVILAASGAGERRIIIAATLHFADGTAVSGVEAYVLNPDAQLPAVTPPGSREIIMPNGERVLEIPVHPGS